VVILGRGGAGKSVLGRRLGELAGLPVIELDSLFWQDGPVPAEPARWATQQHDLAGQDAWVIDGDLGPFDQALGIRLTAADTVIVLDFSLWRCVWRTLRRGREQAIYWRWVLAYRGQYLPRILAAIAANAPNAQVHVLRDPAAVRRFLAGLR
jgi:adenylate kinase family enzyme